MEDCSKGILKIGEIKLWLLLRFLSKSSLKSFISDEL